jgi:hypothetical protein
MAGAKKGEQERWTGLKEDKEEYKLFIQPGEAKVKPGFLLSLLHCKNVNFFYILIEK